KEEIKDVRGQSITLLDLGVIYYERNNYDKAIELLNKSLALKIQINDKRGEGLVYENLGDVANSQKKFSDAITYFTKSKELAIEAKDTIDIATANQQLADQYLNLNNLSQAEKLANEAYPVLKINNDRNFAACLIVLSKVYTTKGDYQKALSYAMEAYRNATASDFPLFVGESSLALANTYEKMNRHDSSYFYQKLYTQINDSILSAQNGEKIAEMQVKYDTEKKEKEIVELDKKNSVAALALSESRNQLSLIAGIFLFIIVAIIAFYFYSNAKKQKQIIEAIITTEEKERKKIASDLHDGVGQTLSAARIGLNNVEASETNQEKLKNVADLINVSLDELKSMAGNLMPLTLKGKGLTESIRNICRQYNKPNVQEVSFKAYDLPDKLQYVVEINTYRICQELLNNSVKYSKAKEIFLQLFCRDKKLIIQFEDNGIGFDKNEIKEGTLGMNILKERV
ncbi:MAG TPA: tetratricopeptide repeat protein, partial [Bacteroidia bacterium]|nr:tetratricopeptide repeat protein [Bacteroidia bacterium]